MGINQNEKLLTRIHLLIYAAISSFHSKCRLLNHNVDVESEILITQKDCNTHVHICRVALE